MHLVICHMKIWLNIPLALVLLLLDIRGLVAGRANEPIAYRSAGKILADCQGQDFPLHFRPQ